MNVDRVNAALKQCRDILKADSDGDSEPVTPVPADTSKPLKGHAALNHVLWMCEEAVSWPAERKEKKLRWLGFVQGVLATELAKTVESMKDMNIPTKEDYPDWLEHTAILWKEDEAQEKLEEAFERITARYLPSGPGTAHYRVDNGEVHHVYFGRFVVRTFPEGRRTIGVLTPVGEKYAAE